MGQEFSDNNRRARDPGTDFLYTAWLCSHTSRRRNAARSSRSFANRAAPPKRERDRLESTISTAFFDTYNASFSDRPGFPGLDTKAMEDWLVDEDFRPDLSLLALVQDDPAGIHCQPLREDRHRMDYSGGREALLPPVRD